MKKKLLFIGIIMNSAGTEKSFLSFVNSLDFDKYDADLILAKNEGLFMPLIDKRVNVKFMPEFGELFLLSGSNAFHNLFNTFVKKNPLTLFEIAPYFCRFVFKKKQKTETAIKLFIKMMGKMTPVEEEYDAAVAYWGDRTMFYMIDKVPNAKKKIAWMHFEYSDEKYDAAVYSDYYKKCDKIVNVSTAVDDALKAKFPEITDKCLVIENIQSPDFIRKRGLEQDSFPDREHFKGLRILTIARISEQKGLDMIPEILARFKRDKYNIRWYIIGDGDEHIKEQVVNLALQHNVAEMLIFLGTTLNPYPFMRDCDIYAQPSRFEGKPISVEEAKIMRCPIVCANYVSAREQLADGRFGRVAEIDPESLYQNIKEMIDNPELRENFVNTLSGENFGNEGEIQKFYDVL
jgi:glycosyltransferase involved in cell wall biosynthesis